ncbi:MAG: IclR family transcriptional regulator [Deltaproteobacteria bacterium]|nr:IclR family transcriptional regulator [Deltaproteobacteria bacterium]
MDLAERLNLHKAICNQLLATLERAGMVAREERNRYPLGPGIALLAGHLLKRYRTLIDLLREPLQGIWETTRETVTVHDRVGAERVCVEELESPEAIAYRAGIGHRASLYLGSASKVLLAFLPAAERAAILRELRLASFTKRIITNSVRLTKELTKVRRAGYSVSSGERITGASAVSVPLLDSEGRVIAAVSILGPNSRLTPEKLRRFAAILKREVRPLPMVLPDSFLFAEEKKK